MAAVLAFLKSGQAIALLGLPGLILILAYSFYKALIGSKTITPLSARHSFIIVCAIIGYFALATVLVIFFFRPVRASPVDPDPNRSAANQVSRIDAFIKNASLLTPIASFQSILGDPDADIEISDAGTRLKAWQTPEKGQRALDIFAVAYDDSKNREKIISVGAMDLTSKLRIIMMHNYEDYFDVHNQHMAISYDHLSDYKFADLIRQPCTDYSHRSESGHGTVNLQEYGRSQIGFFVARNCNFGRAFSESTYAFIFQKEWSPGNGCDVAPFDPDNAEQNIKALKCWGGLKPVGYAIEGSIPNTERLLDYMISTESGDSYVGELNDTAAGIIYENVTAVPIKRWERMPQKTQNSILELGIKPVNN